MSDVHDDAEPRPRDTPGARNTGTHVRRTLLLFVALVAVGVALLLLVPPSAPSDAAPERPDVDASGADDARARTSPGDVRLEKEGREDGATKLTYTFEAGSTHSFDVDLTQSMETFDADGERASAVETTIDAVIELEVSAEDASLGYASVTEFSVDVSADESVVDLPAVSSLLRGIRVELELEPSAGIGKDVPIAATNPQVRRMISLLADALRQAHPPLPTEVVGTGAEWTSDSQWSSDETATDEVLDDAEIRVEGLGAEVERRHSLVDAAGEGHAIVETSLATRLTGETKDTNVEGSGNGEIRSVLDLESGALVESTGEKRFTERTGDGDARRVRTLGLTIRRR